ncbi:16S rRNA (cytosine(1402)-N(4))-methyltransferase RsmH [Candidatus Calescamantes bacterium]|nr:16S rRNA (cytosine(1402)-N(4))-methyltransferase RsmH [Candidatus Calescamantes bacterium]
MIHIPVMAKEVAQYLVWNKEGVYVDGTVGEGGHTLYLLRNFPRIKIIGIDRDMEILKRAKSNLARYRRAKLKKGNFSDLESILYTEGIEKVNGILLDLGFSSFHIEASGRGFSFQKEEFLDMRYDQRENLTAYEIVNTFSKRELEDIFRSFGEEKKAKKIAHAIVEERKRKRISTTYQLKEIIEKEIKRKQKIHPATLIFQALRIAVNRELEHLKNALVHFPQILKEGGRIVVISYHSLEDRIVKRVFHMLKDRGKFILHTQRPIRPTKEEIAVNPRSRSAKLRVGEKK